MLHQQRIHGAHLLIQQINSPLCMLIMGQIETKSKSNQIFPASTAHGERDFLCRVYFVQAVNSESQLLKDDSSIVLPLNKQKKPQLGLVHLSKQLLNTQVGVGYWPPFPQF